jgi:hypothetical protein
MKNFHGEEPHVKIRKTNPKKTDPHEKSVIFVETAYFFPKRIPFRAVGKAVEFSTHEMPKGVARKGVKGEERSI